MNICFPMPNETTSTSVHVFASAASNGPQMTAVQVYVGGQLIYNDTGGATYVDTLFTVNPGSHSIDVKDWDVNGNSNSENEGDHGGVNNKADGGARRRLNSN